MNVFLDDIRPLPDNYIGEWMIVRRVDEVQKLLITKNVGSSILNVRVNPTK